MQSVEGATPGTMDAAKPVLGIDPLPGHPLPGRVRITSGTRATWLDPTAPVGPVGRGNTA